MAHHRITMTQSARVVENVDVRFAVVIDGVKRGELRLSKGGVDWWPRRSRTRVHKRSWTQLAELLES